MNDLIKFRIAAKFVLNRLITTDSELIYGYEHGWIIEEDVVSIALARYNRGLVRVAQEEDLALLLATDFDLVGKLVGALRVNVPETSEDYRAWLYLVLLRVYEYQSDYTDPLGVVEMVYADFGYPREIEGLVRYMPSPSGAPAGIPAIWRRWHDYLFARSEYYRFRDL